MKKFLLTLFVVLCGFSWALAQQKVAVYIAWNDKWSETTKKNSVVFSNALQMEVNRLPQYTAVERSKKYLEQLSKEHAYQRNGEVDDSQVAELGKQDGVNIVLGVSILEYGENTWYIAWKMVDVVSADLVEGNYLMKRVADIIEISGIAKELAGQINGGTYATPTQPGGGSRSVAGRNYTENAFGIDMQMVYVQGGEFMMGCTGEQGSECSNDEKNVHRVSLSGYYIGMLEVTQGQWEKVMGTSIYQQQTKASGSKTYGVGQDYPMYYVSWEEAMAFCEELSRKTGKKYTLPTEAQWEYAARGGNKNDGTKYSGSSSLDAVGWYYDNSGSSTHTCGTKRANGLGLYDMSGNVWEWCKDWYADSYISYQNQDPQGPSSGSYRVLRGGSWADSAQSCRVSNRGNYPPSSRDYDVGFRVVMLP